MERVTESFSTATEQVKTFTEAVTSLPTEAYSALQRLVELVKRTLEPLPAILAPTTVSFLVLADAIGQIGNAAYYARAALRDTARDIVELLRFVSGGGGGPLPGLQYGGPVQRGRAYVVGEAGPELFIPTAGGRIAPGVATPELAGAGGIVVNVYNAGSVVTERDLVSSIRDELSRIDRRNGRI